MLSQHTLGAVTAARQNPHMPSICLLHTEPAPGDPAPHNDNPRRLHRGFADAGWSVELADHDAIRSCNGAVVIGLDERPLAEFDLIWLLGLGRRESFLDRMQLLTSLDPAQFVNTPQAFLTLHAKHGLPLSELGDAHPETYASNDPSWLRARIEQGGEDGPVVEWPPLPEE